MAGFDLNMPDDFMKDVIGLSADSTDRLCEEMLSEASPALEGSMKKRARKATGQMAASIKATKPKKNARGYFTVVRPTGKDAKGVRNAEKLAIQEYGTSRQRAAPLLAASVNDVENQVLTTMQNRFNREVKG